MTDTELVKALKHLAVQTGSLACLGCGYEHSCSVHGCAVIQKAIEALEEKNPACELFRELGYTTRKSDSSTGETILSKPKKCRCPGYETHEEIWINEVSQGISKIRWHTGYDDCEIVELDFDEVLACAQLIREMETADVTEE